jgi:hypothetical protein
MPLSLRSEHMKIVGCDLHTRYKQIAMLAQAFALRLLAITAH